MDEDEYEIWLEEEQYAFEDEMFLRKNTLNRKEKQNGRDSQICCRA